MITEEPSKSQSWREREKKKHIPVQYTGDTLLYQFTIYFIAVCTFIDVNGLPNKKLQPQF